ncbi:AraC family transcriptional regulator [Kibdelosporangium aridum]|uniref:AraC family transcriptional regulator n=1 Tax=Kibdelosporangium aridum TaxID=2030 RepID=UPI0013595DBD|nr:AraC family transcriptional regulator [Kibdelosporangium aridum]
MDFVRASALKGFASLVLELGGDPEPLFARVQLTAEQLEQQDSFVPFAALAQSLEYAAGELDCPDFGRRLARRQSIDILGPVALAARYSRTAEEAIHRMARHMPTYTTALRTSLVELGEGRRRYVVELRARGLPGTSQIHELALGVSHGIAKLLMGPTFRPLRASLPHSALGTEASYREYFDCPVTFDADHCGFDIRGEDLTRQRPTADPLVGELVEQYLREGAVRADDDLPDRVRSLVVQTLPTGRAHVGAVASLLGVHPRTLHRWLAPFGVTFDALVDDVRRERAEHYLRHSALPISSISDLLGYTQQSGFTRACHRWFGGPPLKLRRAWATEQRRSGARAKKALS